MKLDISTSSGRAVTIKKCSKSYIVCCLGIAGVFMKPTAFFDAFSPPSPSSDLKLCSHYIAQAQKPYRKGLSSFNKSQIRTV